MSRSKHQFRPGTLEVFDERVTPSVTPIPGIPFVPPGQVVPYSLAPGYSGAFTVSGNTISATWTNDNTVGHYVTFAVYTAPGGGGNSSSQAYDNLLSQKLVYSQTFFLAAGATHTFSIDVSTLKLTGQDKLQCDVFQADDSTGYAPKKLTEDSLNNHLFGGELFDYEGK